MSPKRSRSPVVILSCLSLHLITSTQIKKSHAPLTAAEMRSGRNTVTTVPPGCTLSRAVVFCRWQTLRTSDGHQLPSINTTTTMKEAPVSLSLHVRGTLSTIYRSKFSTWISWRYIRVDMATPLSYTSLHFFIRDTRGNNVILPHACDHAPRPRVWVWR